MQAASYADIDIARMLPERQESPQETPWRSSGLSRCAQSLRVVPAVAPNSYHGPFDAKPCEWLFCDHRLVCSLNLLDGLIAQESAKRLIEE
jgi:hypothetical protein